MHGVQQLLLLGNFKARVSEVNQPLSSGIPFSPRLHQEVAHLNHKIKLCFIGGNNRLHNQTQLPLSPSTKNHEGWIVQPMETHSVASCHLLMELFIIHILWKLSILSMEIISFEIDFGSSEKLLYFSCQRGMSWFLF